MAYNESELNAGAGGPRVAVDLIGGRVFQRMKPTFGSEGDSTDVSCIFPMPIADRGWEIALGGVPGWTYETVYGENPSISIASGFDTISDIGGTYAPPTSAVTHNVASDDAADAGTETSAGTATGGTITTLVDTGADFVADGVAVGDALLNDTNVEIGRISAVATTTLTFAAGWREPDRGFVGSPTLAGDAYRVITDTTVGAAFVFIKGLTQAFQLQSEFVMMDGTSNVVTTLLYRRINLMRSFGDLSGSSTVGFITATAIGGGALVTSQINNGNNQSLTTVQTVPVGFVGLVTQVSGGLLNKQSAASTLVLRAGSLSGFGYVIAKWPLNSAGTGLFIGKLDPPLRISGGVDIWFEADSDTNNVAISAGYSIVIRDNSTVEPPS